MLKTYSGDYIQGRFIKCKDPNGAVVSQNPGDLGESKVSIPFSYEHVQEACSAARTAFKMWRRLRAQARLDALNRYASTLREHSKNVAEIMTLEIGRPLWETTLEISHTCSLIDYFVAQGSQTELELKQAISDTETIGRVRFFSKGIFAIISPSIQPVLVTHSALVPALVHGNTVVLKSSRHAPLTAQIIAELMHQSGMPSGVFNCIHGNADSSRRLVCHADIDGVFYSGSAETAKAVHKQLSDDFNKTLVLEVGGKNSTVIWHDANYSKALHETIFSSFVSTGQRCTSNGRVFVHDKIFDRFLADFHQLAKRCKVGYGFASPFFGPLISERAVESYLRYQGMAVREGCEEIMRGKVLERERKGYYVSPSIHLTQGFDTKSIYQQNEVFGPDVAFYRIRETDEALSVLGASPARLVTSVYSTTREVYQLFVEDLTTGLLNWNLPTTQVTYHLPYGSPAGNFRPMGSLAGYQCLWPMSSLESRGDFELPLPVELTSSFAL